MPGVRVSDAALAEAGGAPTALFAHGTEEVWLEIGFGAGEHMLWQARANPDIGLIGCEPFLNGVGAALAGIDEQGIDNIRILPDDARPLLDALAPQSIARVFILFPDPWPKSRHNERRIVSPPVLDQLARVMRPGAELRVATDVEDYQVWMLRHLRVHPAFDWCVSTALDWRTRPPDWPETRYEVKAIHEKRPPVYLRFRRSER